MTDPRDREWMARALQLAERGWGRVHPNPLVGAVVVNGAAVAGEGWHAEFGGPHAEVVALRAAAGRTAGATLYVTLEPCAHHGKTPPCTDAILAAGISRVVFAARDPTGQAAGGAEVLRHHGIVVVAGVEEEAARRVNHAFFHVHEAGTPYVALKLALSLDARISRTAGAPTRLTGDAAQAHVHRLRAGFDAIMTGRGTVLADDPSLLVRGSITPRLPPVRIVLDSSASTPPECRMLREIDAAPVWIMTGEKADQSRLAALGAAGARIFAARAGPDGLDLGDVLTLLWQAGVRTVLCEGGGRLAASLIATDAVQRLYLWIAPAILGEAAVPAFPLPHAPPATWRVVEASAHGPDALIIVDREPMIKPD
jgi:diaminohydroxyphosphoribosylaminopyrimidine deaminase/5-amino-6-(5-phosphoribosylamino)uracil reductase